MDCTGDEKRIRALFSELACEDQNRTPQFQNLWRSAAANRNAAAGRVGLLAAVIAFAVIVAVFWIGLWSKYRSTQPLPRREAYLVTTPAPPVIPASPAPAEQQVVRNRSHSHKRLTRRRTIEPAISTDAALLSSWQSPTAAFLESPAQSAFNSLPQLNQSVEDLRSFLPQKTLKESNQ